jgi:hypothetical protein
MRALEMFRWKGGDVKLSVYIFEFFIFWSLQNFNSPTPKRDLKNQFPGLVDQDDNEDDNHEMTS